MNYVRFFGEAVEPTVAEFLSSPGDVRKGVLACLVLSSFNEYYFKTNREEAVGAYRTHNLDAFKRKLRELDWAFGQIMDIANATRHVSSNNGKQLSDLHLESPGECGIARCGFPITFEKHVFIDGENAWMLSGLVEHVVEVWRGRLQPASPTVVTSNARQQA